jgi:hypothetical protein
MVFSLGWGKLFMGNLLVNVSNVLAWRIVSHGMVGARVRDATVQKAGPGAADSPRSEVYLPREFVNEPLQRTWCNGPSRRPSCLGCCR